MNLMNKVFNFVGKTVLTVLIILLIVYGWVFFEVKILLKNNPEFLGFIFYQQADSSMITTFSEDDIVIVQRDAEYMIGDKIMYMAEDNTHYIRTVTGISSNVVTLGCDNCKLESAEVKTNVVVGKAIGKIYGLGKFINFLKQKWLLITMAIVGIGFVIISQYIQEIPKKIS